MGNGSVVCPLLVIVECVMINTYQTSFALLVKKIKVEVNGTECWGIAFGVRALKEPVAGAEAGKKGVCEIYLETT